MDNEIKIYFHNNALKFLDRVSTRTTENIRKKLKNLVLSLTEYGKIPFKELQIRKLEGEWKDLLRMRLGKIRIIFKYDKFRKEIFVLEIGTSGDIYKK